jgi:hypothetical protein
MGNDEDMRPEDIERLERDCGEFFRRAQGPGRRPDDPDPETARKLEKELEEFFGELRDVAKRKEVLERMSRRAPVPTVVDAIDSMSESIRARTEHLGEERRRAAEVAVDEVRNNVSSLRLSSDTVNLVAYGVIFAKATHRLYADQEVFDALNSLMGAVARRCFPKE